MTYIKRFYFLFSFFYLVPIIAVAFVPATVIQGSALDQYILSFVFYILFTLFFFGSIVVFFSAKNFKIPTLSYFEIDSNVSIQNIIFLFTALALTGLILIAIDRIVVRGIDYSLGLRMARYQWLNSTGGGVLGVSGNLLVSFTYSGLFLLFMFFNRIKFKPIYLVILFLCIVGHAALNGGRSNLLIAIFVMIIAYTLRGKSLGSVGGASGSKYFLFVASFAFIFVSIIIYSSAKMGGVDLQNLLYLAIKSFGAIPDEAYFSESHNFFKNLLFYIFSYLFHGSWSSQIALDLDIRDGFYSLATLPFLIINNFFGLGLNLTEKAFDDVGAFITLPGALYYDFGWLGIIFGSLVMAFISSYAIVNLVSCKVINFFTLALYVSLAMFMFMSLILPAYGLVFFYYAVFSLLAIKPTVYIFFRKNIKIRKVNYSNFK